MPSTATAAAATAAAAAAYLAYPTYYAPGSRQQCCLFASRLGIDGSVGNQWGQNAHADAAHDAADDGSERTSALKLFPLSACAPYWL